MTENCYWYNQQTEWWRDKRNRICWHQSTTTVNDYKARGDDSESDFEDDGKSYETGDDSTVKGDNDLVDGPDQLEEDQQQHYSV